MIRSNIMKYKNKQTELRWVQNIIYAYRPRHGDLETTPVLVETKIPVGRTVYILREVLKLENPQKWFSLLDLESLKDKPTTKQVAITRAEMFVLYSAGIIQMKEVPTADGNETVFRINHAFTGIEIFNQKTP